jgi:hypothetical protein
MLEPEIAALHDGAVDHLGTFVEASLVLLCLAVDRGLPLSPGGELNGGVLS